MKTLQNIGERKMDEKYVAYYRVSTNRQGVSGLSLEAQKAECARHKNNIVAEYTEIGSGRKATSNVVLNVALEECKRVGATLIVAKLDRLARDASFVMGLKKAKVEVYFCDMPDVNTLMLGIMASFAEYESEKISSRIKAALQARKDRGLVNGGGKNFTKKDLKRGGKISASNRLAASLIHGKQAYMLAKSLRANGLGYRIISNQLNEAGYVTMTGKPYYVSATKNLLKLHGGK